MTEVTEKRSLQTQGEAVKALSLYEQDIVLWVEDTVAKLKAGDFANVDLVNLIEEVESVGVSQRRELFSRLNRLLEHLLKRLYVNSPEHFNGWEQTIRHQRVELIKLLETSPSLKTQWEKNCEEAWKSALKTVRKAYKNHSFPDRFPYPSDVESMLDRDYWEE